jgi:putative restriction endonuclease
MQHEMFDRTQDARVRAAAFEWLSEQVATYGDVLQRTILSRGFILDGDRIPLLGPQGIFKPRVLRDAPLSITSAPEGPYDDAFGTDGLLRYRYRGTSRDHPDNLGLRIAMERRLPVIYFHGIVPGKYVATWPVFIVNDNPVELFFSVAVDDATHSGLTLDENDGHGFVSEDNMARRVYITAAVRQRLHQRAFRERVLDAYRYQCSFCRLRHEQLLDAAHIIGDTEPQGEPVVRNGLSLCKLHHAAFDKHFVGLRPDYVLEVRSDILRERDGPTLVYAIQALNGASITLPRQPTHRPSRELLEIRYERFRQLAS